MEKNKAQLIAELLILINDSPIEFQSTDVSQAKETSIELLTVKESVAEIKGLSEHTLRLLIKNDKLPHIRTGMGKNGKILINKADLYNYFSRAI